MANTGKDYEKFVANLQQALLNSEKLTTQKNIEVELNKVTYVTGSSLSAPHFPC